MDPTLFMTMIEEEDKTVQKTSVSPETLIVDNKPQETTDNSHQVQKVTPKGSSND